MSGQSERCMRCEGCGLIANDDEGAPWTAWTSLPPQSQLAIRIGMVKPLACPDCGGTGETTASIGTAIANDTADTAAIALAIRTPPPAVPQIVGLEVAGTIYALHGQPARLSDDATVTGPAEEVAKLLAQLGGQQVAVRPIGDATHDLRQSAATDLGTAGTDWPTSRPTTIRKD